MFSCQDFLLIISKKFQTHAHPGTPAGEIYLIIVPSSMGIGVVVKYFWYQCKVLGDIKD